MTYMNNSLFEIETTRVPILLILLSERSLLKGNRNLKAARLTILTRYLIFEIENATEKEMKGKHRSLNMAKRNKSQTRLLQIIPTFFSYVGSFVQ